MKRDRPAPVESEPHVFDQTNGLVDSGGKDPGQAHRGTVEDRTVAGFAMLSTQKP